MTPRTKPLSEADVIAIRYSDDPPAVLAKRYRRSRSTISKIRCGEIHTDAGGPIRQPTPPCLRNAKITPEKAAAIRLELGTPAEIGKRNGLSERSVERIFKKKAWKDSA